MGKRIRNGRSRIIFPLSLTKGARVKASGEHGDYSAAQALDGNMSEDSRWIVKGPGSLEVDLGEEKTFRSVYLASGWKLKPVMPLRTLSSK